jgi:hypothetical protein
MPQEFITHNDPYKTPEGFAETTTPGGGTGYSYQGGTYVRQNGGFRLLNPPQAPNNAMTAVADNRPMPAVVTSSAARTEVKNAQQGLAAELQRLTPAQGTETPKTTTAAPSTAAPAPAVAEPPSTEPPDDPDYAALVKSMTDRSTQLATDFATFQAEADRIRTKANTASASLIESIKTSIARQIEETKKVNDATLKGLTQAGIRAGRSRYTIETEDTSLANEMREGIRRISDLEAKRDSLIAEAELANSREDYDRLYKSWSAAQAASEELNKTVLDLYKIRQENEKAAREAVKTKLDTMKSLSELDEKTVDSIGYLTLNSLTGDDAKDQTTVKAIAAQYGVDPNKLMSKVQELDAANTKYTGEVGEYQFYADQERKSGRIPLDYTGYLRLREAIGNPTRTTVTIDEEGNRSVSTTSVSGGGGGGSVVTPGGPVTPRKTTTAPGKPASPIPASPRVTAIRDAIAALGPQLTKDKRTALTKSIETHLAAGNIEKAKDALLSSTIASLPAEQQNKAHGRNIALDELDRIQGLLASFEAKGGKTSLLRGTQEQIFQKLGATSDPALAEIGNAIRLSIVSYRNAVSGAAFTESEMKEYQGIFPSDKKNAELNTAKIKSLRDAFTNNQASILSNVLGGRDVFKALATPPAAASSAKGSDFSTTLNGKTYRFPTKEALSQFKSKFPSAQ